LRLVRGRQTQARRDAEIACNEMLRYINIMLARPTPGDLKHNKLRKQGQTVIQAVARAGCNEDITPYFHSLVCAIPRQSKKHELMDLSGQALEALNQLMKKRGLSNHRYSVNKRTGAVPQKKMSVGMPEQIIKSVAAVQKTKGMVRGSCRQRKAERAAERDTKKINVKTDEEISMLKSRHNFVTP